MDKPPWSSRCSLQRNTSSSVARCSSTHLTTRVSISGSWRRHVCVPVPDRLRRWPRQLGRFRVGSWWQRQRMGVRTAPCSRLNKSEWACCKAISTAACSDVFPPTFSYCDIYQGFQFTDIRGLNWQTVLSQVIPLLYASAVATRQTWGSSGDGHGTHQRHAAQTSRQPAASAMVQGEPWTPPLCRNALAVVPASRPDARTQERAAHVTRWHSNAGRAPGVPAASVQLLLPSLFFCFIPFSCCGCTAPLFFSSSKQHPTCFHKRSIQNGHLKKVYYISESANKCLFPTKPHFFFT